MGKITEAFKDKWTEFWLHAINNPKSSLSGLFSFIAVTCLGVVGAVPQFKHKYTAVGLALAAGLAKTWVGFLSKDSGTVPATTPDNPKPHAEPSTEVPLNPAATVVTTTTI